MHSAPPIFSLRLVSALLLLGAPMQLRAATASLEAGARLLQAQLPTGTTIPQTACDPLARAVGRATLAHRAAATSILSAALAADPRRPEAKRPCTCVVRVFRVSIAAAPTQTSALFETVSALYPDCADELAAALDRANDKNVVDDKNGPAAAKRDKPFDPNVRDFGAGDPNDPGVDGDLSDRDISGLGFGSGFGPGFPGSPGFTGSPPSGGLALPSPVAETSVVNG